MINKTELIDYADTIMRIIQRLSQYSECSWQMLLTHVDYQSDGRWMSEKSRFRVFSIEEFNFIKQYIKRKYVIIISHINIGMDEFVVFAW